MRESGFYEGLINEATQQRGLGRPNPRCYSGESFAEISRRGALFPEAVADRPDHPEGAEFPAVRCSRLEAVASNHPEAVADRLGHP